MAHTDHNDEGDNRLATIVNILEAPSAGNFEVLHLQSFYFKNHLKITNIFIF